MKHLLTLLLCYLVLCTFGQEYPKKEYTIERLIDEIFPVQDLNINYEDLYENLVQIMANPIDLNKASAEDLRSLYVLKESQVEELLRHREENGDFLSVYELQSLSSFDVQTLYKLIPFIKVKDQSEQLDQSILKRILAEDNNYLVLRLERTLEKRKGDLSPTDSAARFIGSPNKLYSRFRTSRVGDFSVGFTLEKDAGENFNFSDKKPGFDFYSYHTQLINKGKLKNLILGDFITQFGQGLTLGGSFGMGKGAETVTAVRRSNVGFLPYASLNESGFFRGAAATWRVLPDIYIHGFGSHLNKDGRIEDPNEDKAFISSFITTGFHRTPAELRTRKQIVERNYGAVLNFKKRSIDAGLIFHQTLFSSTVFRKPTLYNQFSFEGNRNANAGAFLNYTLDNITFFSELSKTIGRGHAVIVGALGSLAPKLDVALLYRNFGRNFYSFYSNALSENTSPQNETGTYWGWKYSFTKKYSLAGYVDLFRFPWLRFRGYAPSNGSEWLLRFNYQPSKTVLIYVQAREENKIRNLDTETNVYETATGRKRNLWINLDYSTGSKWSFKTRAQFSDYKLSDTTHGLALIQDLNLDLGRFAISTRYALFDTDDYDNRQYTYERDVWLALSMPALDGVGIRNYIMIQYKLTRKMDIWLRWARTIYTDKETIGSGSDQIDGNIKNDLKFQARIRL